MLTCGISLAKKSQASGGQANHAVFVCIIARLESNRVRNSSGIDLIKGRPLAVTFSEAHDAEARRLSRSIGCQAHQRAELRSAGRPMTIVCRTHSTKQCRSGGDTGWRPLRMWPLVEKGIGVGTGVRWWLTPESRQAASKSAVRLVEYSTTRSQITVPCDL